LDELEVFLARIAQDTRPSLAASGGVTKKKLGVGVKVLEMGRKQLKKMRCTRDGRKRNLGSHKRNC